MINEATMQELRKWLLEKIKASEIKESDIERIQINKYMIKVTCLRYENTRTYIFLSTCLHSILYYTLSFELFIICDLSLGFI